MIEQKTNTRLDGQQREASRPIWSWRGGLLFALKILTSLGLIFACIHFIELKSITDAFEGANVLDIFLAFAIAVLGTIILPSFATKKALSIERVRLSLLELFQINFAMRFYVIVLPRAFSIWLRWLRYKKGGTGSDALALLAFERATQMAILFAITLIAAASELPQLGNWGEAVLIVCAVGAVASCAALAPFLSPWTATKLKALSQGADRALPSFLSQRLRNLTTAVASFQHLPNQATLTILSTTMAGFFCFVFSAYVLAQALELNVSFVALVWVRGLVFVLTLLPVTVAGVGLREIGFIGLLSLYDISAPEAMSFSLANFGIQLSIAAVGAALEIGRVLRGARHHSDSALGAKEENQ